MTINMRRTALVFLLFIYGGAIGQNIDDYFNKIRPVFNGDNAMKTVAFVEQYWRMPGNSGFNKSIDHIVQELKSAGYQEEGSGDSRFTFRIEHRPLNQPSWEPVDAMVRISGDKDPLLKFSANRNMIAVNSFSTNGLIKAEIVRLENGKVPDGISAEGKILYLEGSIYKAYQIALKEGAVGVITYSNPGYLQPEKNKTSIQFRYLPYKEEFKLWGICLSYEANERLKSALDKGSVNLEANIKTKFTASDELTLVAEVRGSKYPEKRFVLSAHVQEPGANDNASGVGTQMEMARVTKMLVQGGNLDPARTITFIWGNEIESSRNFVQDDSIRKKNIKWALSLDMVGENTDLTGGSFLIEKMPDPSAIWTRGKDQHTEWGAGDVKESDFFPHYMNDLVAYIFNKQGDYAQWTIKENPFEGGSDHVPFVKAGIPCVLLWHFTDQFYHSDLDRLDKVSAAEMANVGTAALTLVHYLINSTYESANAVDLIVKNAALDRLKREFVLSNAAIQSGGDREEQIHILKAWKEWYIRALGSAYDLALDEAQKRMMDLVIGEYVQEVSEFYDKQIANLGK